MRQLRRAVSTCCLLLALLPLHGTVPTKVVLSGEVKDKEGTPLYQAIVALEGTEFGTYTDEQGRYSFKLPAGKHLITASYLGLTSSTKTVEIKKDQRCDFILEEGAIDLQSVNVYGKTISQQVKEGAFSVNALEIKPLKNSHANLASIINRTTGIKIREQGGVGSNFELSINGLSGNSVRIFIDGMPLSSMVSGLDLGNLPINMVERIEIFKGVVPTYLGADALGGAVNIITKKEQHNYLEASYSIGSFHTHKADMNAQYVTPKLGLVIRPTVGFNTSKNDYLMKDVEIWDNAERVYKKKDFKRFHDGYLFFLGQLEMGFQNRKWADLLMCTFSTSILRNELQTGNVQTIVYGQAERKKQAINTSLQYKKQDFLLSNLDVNFYISHTSSHSLTIDTAFRRYAWDGSYDNTYRNEILGRGKAIRHYHRPLTLIRSNINYMVNDHHSVNVNYVLNNLVNKRSDELDKQFDPSSDILTKQTLGLSYTQNLLNQKMNNVFFLKHYINRLEVTQQELYWITGAQKKKGTTINHYTGYGVGSRFTINEQLALKASWERAIRLPLAYEYMGNGTTTHPNYALKPESSHNFNLGLFGNRTIANRGRLNYEASFFTRKVKDYIRRIISVADGLNQYGNVDNVTIRGMETEVRYEHDDLFQAVVNCSYQDARSKTRYYQDGTPQITYNNKIPNRPWLYGNLELNFIKKDLFYKESRLKMGYYAQYVHWFYLTWEGYGTLKSKSTIPTQLSHNLLVAYTLKNGKYSLSAECKNLLNSTSYDNFMLQKPGRSFLCKFTVFLN